MQRQDNGNYIGESGIVFPSTDPAPYPRQGAIEAWHHETLLILKKHEDAPTARAMANAEYDRFFAQWRKFVQRSTHVVLNERYAAEGKIGYLIRVDIEATESTMREIKQWVAIHIQSEGIG